MTQIAGNTDQSEHYGLHLHYFNYKKQINPMKPLSQTQKNKFDGLLIILTLEDWYLNFTSIAGTD